MINFKWILSNRYISLIILLLCFSSFSHANSNLRLNSSAEGKVVHKQGRVQIHKAINNKWVYAKPGSLLHAGDTIRTGANGKASLMMSDETIMQVGRNSKLQITHVAKNAGWFERSVIAKSIKQASRSVYSLISGKLWARNKNKKVNARFKLVTSSIGIRGTELTIEAKEDGTVTSTVLEGKIEASNEFGTLVAEHGNQVTMIPGQAPIKSILLNPQDAVQWTFVIPPLIGADDFSTQSVSADTQKLLQSGDYAGASAQVSKLLSRSPNDSSLQLLDAVLDIFNGEPKRALEKLNDLASSASDNALLARSLATANIMLGNKESAKQAADQAVILEPDIAANHIVLAYVEQSRFELENAIKSVNAALRIEPDNIQAAVMLAQLKFGSGYIDQAMNTLLAAHEKAPDNAEINNLAGFVLMSQRKLDDAKNAFNTAIRNDAGTAESHMGLGLIYMREGDAERALEEITSAVALEPQRSLFLSYWGKMLYQVERFDKALDMFEHAALLDKNDPTPVFYKSIVLRDLNRPGESIEALNKAVELNDNRAVYRSRFLLDQDLAVRNVDLSILYSQLGLKRSAERKAVSAIKSDYTNYSAHLFYYGALSAYDDRSYPAGSEALLARMLQPANVNTFNTFNDYTAFFEQPNIGGLVTLRGGNNETKGGDIIIHGAAPDNNFAYNFGLFSETTDGWRDTNSEKNKTAAFIGKWQPTEQNGILMTAQYNEIEEHDSFDERYEFDSLSSPNDELDLELAAFELGYHYKASPRSSFLFYGTHQENTTKQFTATSEFSAGLYFESDITKEYERPYDQLQLQYIAKLDNHQLIAGVNGFSGKTKLKYGNEYARVVDRSLIPPFVILEIETLDPSYELDINFISAYVQDNWKINDDLAIEAAVYVDKMENMDVEWDSVNSMWNITPWKLDKINPRLGLIWDINTRNTVRLAAFQYMLPFVSSRLDPVDVAGVPIFRNTEEGAVIKEVDLAWEYEMEAGMISFGIFHLDKEIPSSTVALEGEIDGAEITFETLITTTTGLSANYKYSSIENQSMPSLNRHDGLFTIALRNQQANGFSIGIQNSYRVMVFDNDRESENINILDMDIGYEIGDKNANVSLEVRNILDEEFNWVVDQFVINGRNPAREILLTGTFNF
ncbi:tetratricopeptide repeat protein [Pseudomonadota bacterium]